MKPSILTKKQTRVYGPKTFVKDGTKFRIVATVRYDDQCGNGHNTFSITGEIRDARGDGNSSLSGCIHDEIAKHFPELRPLIKWHLVSSDGPMHYVANTVYHASNRDHWRLLEGETRQIRNGKTGKLCWRLSDVSAPETVEADECPPPPPPVVYIPWVMVGKGKKRDLEHARSSAVWPEATDEQLCLPEAELTALLLARLPKLMEDFQVAVESLGFTY